MTKDEMVQRLYIRYLTEESTCSPKAASCALDIAIEEADYYFEHCKPKKKREVYLARAEFVEQARLAILSDANMPEGWRKAELCAVFEALREGKSVRMR